MSNLKILLADDHAVVREGLKRLIEKESDMIVVAEVEDGLEAVAKAVQLSPDVIVMDISMGPNGGLQATREVRQRCPSTRVLTFTVHEDQGYVQELLEAGASGYVLKRAASDELIGAIRAIAANGVYVDTRIAGKLFASMVGNHSAVGRPHTALTERETAVLRLIAQGYTNKEIGAQLDVSVKTVETFKARAMEKLGLRSRVDIVRVATECGWLRS